MVTLLNRPALGTPKSWVFPASDVWMLPTGVTGKHLHTPFDEMLHVTTRFTAPLTEEDENYFGVTEFMFSLLTEGADGLNGAEFAAQADRIAATIKGRIDDDGVSVTLSVPASRAAQGIELLASALLRPHFAAEEIERIRELRRSDFLMAEADPSAQANNAYRAHLYEAGSRWATPVGGNLESLDRIDREAIVGRYREIVNRERMVVVSAGNIEATALQTILNTSFSALPRTDIPAPTPGHAPSGTPRAVFIDRPGALQTEVRIGTVTATRQHSAWAGGLVAAHALAGGMRSRLNLVLREEKGYTYGVRARFSALSTAGTFTVSGSFEASVTGDALAETLRILSEMRAGGPDELEQSSAVDAIVVGAPVTTQTAHDLHDLLLTGVSTGLRDGWYARLLQSVQRTSATATGESYRQLVPQDLVCVLVGDYKLAAPQFKQAGITIDAVL